LDSHYVFALRQEAALPSQSHQKEVESAVAWIKIAAAMGRILIIDDDSNSALAVRLLLEEQGHEVKVQLESPKALDAVRTFKPDAVLIDFMMPNAHGGDVAWLLNAQRELDGIKLVLYSHIPPSVIRPKLPLRDIPILEKPVSVEELFAALKDLPTGSF
jgi:two-component system, OmpR family, alkaline phosphatase synthesis response regulator PhoP